MMPLLRCDVEEVSPDGLKVKVWDLGLDGFIPPREAFASPREAAFLWNKLGDGQDRIGMKDRLLACRFDESRASQGRFLLSRRKAIEQQYAQIQVGDVVALTITEMTSKSVFGRVRGGIRARADRAFTEKALQAIPPLTRSKQDNFTLAIHETVAGFVVLKGPSSDPLLTLDVPAYLRSLQATGAVVHPWRLHEHGWLGIRDRQIQPSHPQADQSHAPFGPAPNEPIHAPKTHYSKVLIVDDDETLLPRLTEFFAGAACEPVPQTTLSGAERALREDTGIDLLIADLNWETTNAVRWADGMFTDIRAIDCVLMTTVMGNPADPLVGDKRLSELVREAAHGQRFKGLWDKSGPQSLNGLVAILTSIDGGQRIASAERSPVRAVSSPKPPTPNPAGGQRPDCDSQLQACVDRIAPLFPGGTTLILFSLAWSTFEVKLHASSSATARRAFAHQKLNEHLYKSPIRDLLVDREKIDETDVAEHEAKYRWLLKLLPFSCILGRELDSPFADPLYAIFLFGTEPEHLNAWCRTQLELCVKEMEMVLFRDFKEAEIATSREMAALGAAHQKMAHEVKAKAGYILQAARRTTQDWTHLEKLAEDCFYVANEILPDASFGTPEAIDVRAELERILHDHLIEHPSGWARLRLGYVSPSLPKPRTRPIILRTILANLIGNAGDFLKLSNRPQGEIVIEALANEQYQPPFIEIWCHDAACGIRTRIEEMIFNPRFSTKEGGTGYGLAICRDFALKSRGTIEVGETILGAGTSFVLRLPV